MFTPIELRNMQFRPGRGYNREEMDEFLNELFDSYEKIYKENEELKNDINKLNDGVQYYKSMETTLQKALVLAEKTASETIAEAETKANEIVKEAHEKADEIIHDAYVSRDDLKNKSASLNDYYYAFKEQYRQIALKQLELLDSDFYELKIDGSEEILKEFEAEEKTEKETVTGDTVRYEPVTESSEDLDVFKSVEDALKNAPENDDASDPATEENNDNESSEDPIDEFFKELKKDPANDINSNISDSSFEFFDNK